MARYVVPGTFSARRTAKSPAPVFRAVRNAEQVAQRDLARTQRLQRTKARMVARP